MVVCQRVSTVSIRISGSKGTWWLPRDSRLVPSIFLHPDFAVSPCERFFRIRRIYPLFQFFPKVRNCLSRYVFSFAITFGSLARL